MRKKWLALLLSLCMVLSLFPAAVFAEGGDAAETGGTKYPTLQGAIAAAGSGKTVTLLKDVKEDVAVSGDKSIILDLNGNTLTNVSGHTVTVSFGGSLTITDRQGGGGVDNVTHAKSAVFNNGTVVLSGGNYTRSAENSTTNSYYTILNHGSMTIEKGASVTQKGHFSSMIASGYYNYFSGNSSSGYVKGENWQYPELTITGGTFTGGLNTVKNDDGGILDISGGTFSNTAQSAVMNWNKTTISGGNFSTKAENVIANGYLPGGVDEGKLTITGGSFQCFGTLLGVGSEAKSTGTIALKGGSFQYKNAVFPELPTSISKGTTEISGGSFSTDVTEYLAPGKAAVEEDGKWVIQQLPYVASIGDVRYYSLAEAVADAESGSVIELLQDAKGGGVVFKENGRTLTIDFNGFTYTVTNPTVGSAGTETNGFQLLKGNTVTLKNGTLKAGSSARILLQNYCDLTLEDITVDCRESSQCGYALSNNFGNITLKGNTNLYAAEGKTAFDLWYGLSQVYYDGVSVTVDESMTGTIQGKIEYGSQVSKEGWQEKTKLEIRGGHFDGNFAASSEGALEGANIAIYGGYFTSDPSDYAAEGYVAIASDKAGYSYKVTEKAYTGDIEVRPDVSDNDVRKEQISDDINEAEKDALLKAAGSVKVSDLAAQSGNIANEITEEEANQAADALREETGKETKDEDITIYVQTFLDVQPKDYNAAESTLVLDVTPRYQVVASTADTAGQIDLEGKDKNAVVQESGELEIVSPVELSLQLPDGFSDNPKLYITHTKEGGKQYVYTGTLEGNTLTFTNPHGFSEFSVGKENPAAAEIEHIGYLSLQDAVDEVANNDTIVLLKEGQEATVSKIVRFTLSSVGGYTAEIQPGPRYSMSYDEDTGTYAFTRRHVTNSDGESIGWELPLRGDTSPAFESDTTYDLTVNDVYQFRITSLDGHTPAMTLGNGNFRVELASRSGNDYFFKVYVQGNVGSTCGVFVDGQYLLTLTVGGSAVVSDTTAPFTVAQGGTYQFKLTAAQQPAFAAGSPCFTVEYAGNSGNDWFYKVHAVGEAGESSGFYINGSASPVAVASIG